MLSSLNVDEKKKLLPESCIPSHCPVARHHRDLLCPRIELIAAPNHFCPCSYSYSRYAHILSAWCLLLQSIFGTFPTIALFLSLSIFFSHSLDIARASPFILYTICHYIEVVMYISIIEAGFRDWLHDLMQNCKRHGSAKTNLQMLSVNNMGVIEKSAW